MKLTYVIAGIALLVACTRAPQGQAAAEDGSTSIALATSPAVQDTVQKGPLYVDVRTREEFDAGHVKGALLIPYDEMEQRWQELSLYRDRPVVLYCRTGRRAGIALEVLKAKGFTKLENGGGVEQLAAKGLAIVPTK